jgi:hypothetical protein
MAIRDLINLQATLQRHEDEIRTLLNTTPPLAWVIVANPVWGRAEDLNCIAVFDTRELAIAYEAASRLKQPDMGPDGKIYRTYRSDSLLWDYNPEGVHQRRGPEFMIVPAGLRLPVADFSHNPAPPSGDDPPLLPLNKPRYGEDYDVGRGPGETGYTDSSHVVPDLKDR